MSVKGQARRFGRPSSTSGVTPRAYVRLRSNIRRNGPEPEVARSAKLTARGGVPPPVKSPSTTYIRSARPLFLSGIADTGNNFGAQNFRVSMGDA